MTTATEKAVSILEKGFTTPMGKARWCKVVRPDTKFNEGGVYSTDLILEGADAEALINKLDELAAVYQKEIKKKVTKMPYEALVGEDGQETGEFKFKFKMNATTKYGPRRPALFDSTGVQLKTPVEVGNDSLIRVKATIKGYKLGPGLTLELSAVQIVELVEYGGSNSFDAVEGGGFKAGSQSNEQSEGQEGDW